MNPGKNAALDTLAPGFEIVRNDENGFYYFRCNDIDGKVVLWSKDFQSKSTVESKMEQALRLARQTKNYIRKKEGDAHFFSLIGGNKKEIAKSTSFKNEKDLQRTIDYVKQVANSSIAIATTPSPTEMHPTNTISEQAEIKEPLLEESVRTLEKPKTNGTKKASTQATAKSRYAFKIDLYPREDENTLSGRIEYLLTEESANFQGLDTAAIVAFMKKYLPAGTEEQLEKAMVREQATLVLLSEPGGRVIHAQDAGQAKLHFILHDLEKPFTNYADLNAKVVVRSLDNTAHITSLDGKLTVSDNKETLLSLPGKYFSTGIYRIQVTCVLNDSDTMTRMIEAGCLFQIY